MEDRYLTINASAEGEFKDRGSKFFAYAFSVADEEAIKDCLTEVRELHPKARHHCYAYRLGVDKHHFRAADDGEPSGTAGKPILGQIDKQGLSHVLVVVVRYFGGTKLGVGGLINAYKTATEEALVNVATKEVFLRDAFVLQFPYNQIGAFEKYCEANEIEIRDRVFNQDVKCIIGVRKSKVEGFLKQASSYDFQLKFGPTSHL